MKLRFSAAKQSANQEARKPEKGEPLPIVYHSLRKRNTKKINSPTKMSEEPNAVLKRRNING